jgi:hypothetical protein
MGKCCRLYESYISSQIFDAAPKDASAGILLCLGATTIGRAKQGADL